MTHAITFDTLAYAKKLESSGMPQKQAETQSEALADVLNGGLDLLVNDVSTKSDIALLRKDIEKVAIDVDNKLSKLETKLILWVVGLLFAQTAIILSCIKLFH